MKTIRIHRNKGWYGRIRALKIIVDDKEVAVLKADESITVQVDDNAEFIWGKMDWGKTDSLDIDNLSSEQMVHFDAFFSFNPLRQIGSSNLPFRVYAS